MNGDKKSRSGETLERLLRRRQELMAILSSQQDQLSINQDGGDVIEGAFKEATSTVGSEIAGVASRELSSVNFVLELISDGKYGKCESCGKQISEARLRVIPSATRCAPCQSKEEVLEATQPQSGQNVLFFDDIFSDLQRR